MATRQPQSKIVVIVGPTASGKSDLALSLAISQQGEIISADSRALYKGMDIGTAKPSHDDQNRARHWGIDLINPDEKFSAKQFKDYAASAIKDISQRSKLPILAGGTGLYIDSVVFDYDFNSSSRRDPTNPRHSFKKGGSRHYLGEGIVMVGLDPGKKELEHRIVHRTDKIVGENFIQEAARLLDRYEDKLEAFKAPGYQPILAYLKGEIDLAGVRQRFIQNDLKLAKKQRTWFKKNPYIKWFTNADDAEQYILERLNT